MFTHTKPLLSRAEVGQLLGVSVQTVSKLIAKGIINSVKVGSRVRIDVESVDHYLGAIAQKGGGK